MSTLNYQHCGLAPQFPLGVADDKPIRFHVTLKAQNDRIVLRFEQPDVPGRDYIAIKKDSIVEIVLKGDQLYFSKDIDGITTKQPLASFYGGLEYDGYDEKLDRYKIARFRARFNKGGKYGTRHAFNVNVDLLQLSPSGEPQWTALSIDPDIKNPPPKDD
ncbi:nucleotide synthetase [Sphingobium ummariense]|uniref:Uncharacterized protein n=1 Tax=Sphingobium ummariense RL-3 TaxID=1346791 RepID=T0K1Y6_9SPHN|nr:nucleotide synthetase [Sphingobium ummariense]EQB30559.1 hypothetical protein M529_19610 [Sphingobium ummariense RL-3]